MKKFGLLANSDSWASRGKILDTFITHFSLLSVMVVDVVAAAEVDIIVMPVVLTVTTFHWPCFKIMHVAPTIVVLVSVATYTFMV